MLSFATEFPIDISCTRDTVIDAVKTWILGSQHSGLSEEDFLGINDSRDWSVENGPEWISSIAHQSDDSESVGVRYGKKSDGLEWITSIVFSQQASASWIGVRVHCEAHGASPQLPSAKKPVLVRTLLEACGGGGFDGPLPIAQMAYELCDSDVALAASIIRGDSECYLPVVYVSAEFGAERSLDANRLAASLSGMAHVIVEPNRAFSTRLQPEVRSQNVYGGAIGVYWPDSSGRRHSYFPQNFRHAGMLVDAVASDIQTALTHRRPMKRCTWAALQETVAQTSLKTLREKGSSDLDEYAWEFDRELDAKKQQLQEAEDEIGRLRAEIGMYQAMASSNEGVTLQDGGEQDLYPGEVLGIVCREIAESVTRCTPDTRRIHVLQGLMDANPIAGASGELHRGSLKALLRGYKSMDAKVRRGLEEMGFGISEDGKHYKLVFRGDARYTFTLPKSGSDRRGGLNAARDISNALF